MFTCVFLMIAIFDDSVFDDSEDSDRCKISLVFDLDVIIFCLV